MSMINKEINEFCVQAYQNNAFKTITKADILGQWSVFFFYPADYTRILKRLDVKYIRYLQIPILRIKRGTILPNVSEKLPILC